MPERDLWWAVIERAAVDALWPTPSTGSAVTVGDQRVARSWFRGCRGFRDACNLAGADPDFIRSRIVPMFNAPPSERAEWLGRLRADLRRQLSRLPNGKDEGKAA